MLSSPYFVISKTCNFQIIKLVVPKGKKLKNQVWKNLIITKSTNIVLLQVL